MTYSLAPYRSLGGSSPEVPPKFWWSLLHQIGLTHTPDLQWHKKLLCLPNISYKTSQCCVFFYPVSGDLGFDFGFKWLQITIIRRAVGQHTQSKLAIWPGASFYVETAAWAPSRLSFEKSMEGPLLRLGIRSSAIQNCPSSGFQPLSKRHWSPCMRNPTSNPGVFLVFFLLVQDIPMDAPPPRRYAIGLSNSVAYLRILSKYSFMASSFCGCLHDTAGHDTTCFRKLETRIPPYG